MSSLKTIALMAALVGAASAFEAPVVRRKEVKTPSNTPADEEKLDKAAKKRARKAARNIRLNGGQA